METPVLSVVVPCYNESGNIPLIIERFREVLKDRADVEILLVNNGSTDDSASVFISELEKVNDSRFRVVEVTENKGYGFGILSGLKAGTGQILSWTHADMQTDPEDVLKALNVYQQANDESLIVKGVRKKRKLAEAFFTWGMQVISSMALSTPLHDINAQPKLFSRSFYDRYMKDDAPYDFSLDLYLLYWATREARITEIPVYFKKRMHGEAKGGGSFKTRMKLIKRTWAYIFELRNALH